MSHTLRSTILSIALLVCLLPAAEPAAAQAKLLTVPDTTAKKGDTLLVPLRIASLATLDSVYSGQFTISYNSGVMYVYDISTAGTLLSGVGNVSFNPTTRQLAFASGTIITGTAPLIYLKVATAVSPSSLSDSLRVTFALFNEGTPAITIKNGYFRFRTITISPKNPPGNLVVGDSLQFSVSGDQIPPLTWLSSNPSFATIDANGKLRGVGVGQLTVYVQDSQGLKDSTSLFPINSALLNSLTLSLHDTNYTQTLTFNLPVYISNVTGLGIISSQFTMTFNSSILQALDVINAGSMSSTWATPAYNISGGRIDVAIAGSQPLTGAGVLAYVRFKVLSTASGSTTLALSNALFNETIHASLVNSTFGTITAPTLIIAPSTATLTRGDTTTFRVTSGGHPPYNWTSNAPSIVTINSTTGFLTAVARGTTTITVVDSLGFTATSGAITVNDLRISLPDTLVNIADSVDVPITTDLLTGLGIYSYDFRLVYDSTVVRFAQLFTAGTLSSSMNIAVRDTLDTLRVAAAGSAALSGAGTLLKIRFKAAPGASISQLSNIRFAFFTFNETGSGTATATPVNGKITIGNVIPSAPAAPTLLSPSSGATGVAVAPTLSWNASTGAASYTLQLATNSSFTSILLLQPGITTTSYNPPGLVNDAQYYWRVSATNAGGTSAYSTGFSFTTIIAAPPPPTLVSPANAGTGVSVTPTLSWNAASTATSYTVQVSTSSTFASYVINQAGVASTSYVTGVLSANTTYYWRVSGTNVGGTGSYSSTYSFATGSGTPAAPTLASPANGAGSISLSPTLTWAASSGATSYTVQISAASNFSTLLVNQSGITTTSYPASGLANGTTYYWRVSATNASGTSSFSSTFSFTVSAPPVAPTLLSPPDGSSSVAMNPTFSWSATAGATSYTVQISGTSNFSTLLVNQSGITTTSYGTSGLAYGTTYYWRVSATNGGGTSAFSATFSFTTITAAPPAPILLFPTDGSASVAVNPTLRWYPVASATSYIVQISSAADFSALVVNQSGITSNNYSARGLSNQALYYWRVSATNAGGTSPFSSTFSFTTVPVPPGAPTLSSPSNGASSVAVNPTVSWSPVVGATSYTVQVSTAADFSSTAVIQGGIAATNLGVSGLAYSTTYYWRVTAQNDGGTSPYSSVFSFTTTIAPPSAPTLVSPATGATSVSINPTLGWNASATATSYTLQVSSTADFSTTVVNLSGLTLTSIGVTSLAYNTQYYWRVSATNAGGTSSFSTPFTFTTVIPPPAAPTLSSPANNATGIAITDSLRWSASPSATSYTLQVSTTADFSSGMTSLSGLTTTSSGATGLLNGTHYYWRVSATNMGGTSSYSTPFSFTTIIAAPAAPTLLSPATDTTGVPLSLTLSWNAAARASTYLLQVSTLTDFSVLAFSQSGLITTLSVVSGLTNNTRYFWRVNATNVGGTSPYSSAFAFTTVIAPPAVPVLLAPVSGTIQVSTSPTLSWFPSPTATSYNVQVSTKADFSTLVASQTGLKTLSATFSGLQENTVYYWRVSGTNVGGMGDYSTPFSFTTRVLPPTIPALLFPANGATSVAIGPTLSWSASPNATSYRLQISKRLDYTTFALDTSVIGGTLFAVSNLEYNSLYYWHVRAINASGSSPFSGDFSFTTIPAAPTPPSLLVPPNGATGASINSTLSWNASANATNYTLQISTSPTFPPLTTDVQTGITGTSAIVGPLKYSTTYYWRVGATGIGGTSAYSSVFSFITIIAPPSGTTLISPANGATGVAVSPTLVWHSSPGATSYTIQISTTSNMSALVFNQANITDTLISVGPLSAGTQYYWAVRAANAGGSSAFSAISSFTTIVLPPQAPTLISPTNGATGVSLSPALVWHSSPGATSYTVQVSTTSNMSALVFNQANITDTLVSVGPLSFGTQYYWAVRAANAGGSSAFSAISSFTTIVLPPQAPTLISPTNGATGVSLSPTLVWHSSPGATSYTVQVSTTANMSTLVFNQANIIDTLISVGPLSAGKQYYWAVRAANAGGSSAFSVTSSFTTIVLPPQAPTLISPTNGATGVSLTPTLVWHSSPGATSYTVQISTSANMSTLVFNQANITDTSINVGPLSAGKQYYWAVRAANAGGSSAFSVISSFATTSNATTVESVKGTITDQYELSQNYPNPFNPSTMVPYSLPHRSFVRLSVYSLLGKEVVVLVNGERSAGVYEVRLQANDFPSGVYLIKMQASPVEGGADRPFVATRKIVLIK